MSIAVEDTDQLLEGGAHPPKNSFYLPITIERVKSRNIAFGVVGIVYVGPPLAQILKKCNVKIENKTSIYSGTTYDEGVFIGPSMVYTNPKNPPREINRRCDYTSTPFSRNATIICGRHAFIRAASVVTNDERPYALIIRNTGNQVAWMRRFSEKLPLPLSQIKTPRYVLYVRKAMKCTPP